MGGQMTHIMVVDINATTAYRIKKILENVPVEIVSASTMYEAINRVGNLQSVLDMIIIDVNLGPEDGFELIGKLRDINPNLVVIIATSLNTRKSFVKAIRVGANDYILKPFDDDYFRSKLTAHISQIDQAKTLPVSSTKQIDISIYNAIKKAIRENHELLIGLILFYNKQNPAMTISGVRDLALIKGLGRELETDLNPDDELFNHDNNGFVVVLHKKSLSSKPQVLEHYKTLCTDYLLEKNLDVFDFEIAFLNLPNEIDPRHNALSVLMQKIEKNMK
jgi:CheY-like chemotaxis protein